MIKQVISTAKLKKLLNGKLYKKYKMMKISYLDRMLLVHTIMFYILSTLYIYEIISIKLFSISCLINILLLSLTCCRFIILTFGKGKYMNENLIIDYLMQHNNEQIALNLSISDIVDEHCIRLNIHNKEHYMYLDSYEMEKVRMEKQIILHRTFEIKEGNVYEVFINRTYLRNSMRTC